MVANCAFSHCLFICSKFVPKYGKLIKAAPWENPSFDDFSSYNNFSLKWMNICEPKNDSRLKKACVASNLSEGMWTILGNFSRWKGENIPGKRDFFLVDDNDKLMMRADSASYLMFWYHTVWERVEASGKKDFWKWMGTRTPTPTATRITPEFHWFPKIWHICNNWSPNTTQQC